MGKKYKISCLEKKIPEIREQFFAEMEMLAIFLNYLPTVQIKWLKEMKLKKKDIENILKIADYYAKLKVKMINENPPKNREDVIKIENECLRKIYTPRLMNITPCRWKWRCKRIAEKLIRKKWPNATIFKKKQIRKFKKLLREKKVMTDFLVFDPESKRIIGIEVENIKSL